MQNEQVYAYIKEVTPSRSKDVRAQSIRGRMSLGKVRFPFVASWWPAAMHELLTFPAGNTDDFVDFIAHIGLGLTSMAQATTIQPDHPEDLKPPTITMKWIKESARLQEERERGRYQGR